ncbi:MAG: ABC transporter substrate-binding protein [Chloroflexota bacterium]|nr:ABC transporter substrate-binding protein [Chloroflexota bacterium]
MFSRKWYTLVSVVMLAGLALTACGGGEVQTVVITAPPEKIEVEVEVPVEVTVPPEIVEVTAEPGLGAGCTYNAYRMGWVMDYGDAENVLNVVYHPDSPFQYSFWHDDTYVDLVDQALMEFDSATRAELWKQAEQIMMTDYAAFAPIFYYDRTALLLPEIEAVYPPFGSPPYKHWVLPEGQTTLRVSIGAEPPTLDVNTATDTTSHLIQHQIMDSLYEYKGDGSIEPAGAVSFEVSDDGLVYTIKLREGAAWSDGEPVTAQHFVDGLTRLLEPATAAEYAWLMYIVQGAEAFNTGETDDPSTLGVKAVDDLTLEITLKEAASYFESILAFSTTYPVRLDVIEEYGNLWAEPGNFVGNGAYLLTEWAHDDYVAIDKNPDYWGADDVTIERVEFSIILEDATALAAYERGELDVGAFPSEEITRLLEDTPDHIRVLVRPGPYYIGFNFLRPPTDNLNMRKALASSINKRAILDSVMEMPWRNVACGVVPPGIPGYQGCGEVGYEFDVDAALGYLDAYMAEADVAEPGDITVNLWFNRGNEDVLDAVAEQWETNLGISVNVSIMEWAAYLDTLDECNN